MVVKIKKKILDQEDKLIHLLEQERSPASAIKHIISRLSEHTKFHFCLKEAIIQSRKRMTSIERKSANRTKSIVLKDTNPPIDQGRRVIVEEKSPLGWLRQEYVPCRSSRCKKQPDEHGPYWYSYRFINNVWSTRYHGKIRPTLKSEISIKEARSIIDHISVLKTISEEDIHKLQQIVADFASINHDEIIGLKQRAIVLIKRERTRRDTLVQEKHSLLLKKVESGQSLDESERETLRITAAILTGDR